MLYKWDSWLWFIVYILILLWLLDISMLTRLEMLRIENTHLMFFFIFFLFLLVFVLWLGLVWNKTLYPYLLLKLSILLLKIVVHNSYGWSKCLKIMELSKELCAYTVTTLVLWISQRILSFIHVLSTLKSIIISLRILLKKRLFL